jgi:hypothetical protein
VEVVRRGLSVAVLAAVEAHGLGVVGCYRKLVPYGDRRYWLSSSRAAEIGRSKDSGVFHAIDANSRDSQELVRAAEGGQICLQFGQKWLAIVVRAVAAGPAHERHQPELCQVANQAIGDCIPSDRAARTLRHPYRPHRRTGADRRGYGADGGRDRRDVRRARTPLPPAAG